MLLALLLALPQVWPLASLASLAIHAPSSLKILAVTLSMGAPPSAAVIRPQMPELLRRVLDTWLAEKPAK